MRLMEQLEFQRKLLVEAAIGILCLSTVHREEDVRCCLWEQVDTPAVLRCQGDQKKRNRLIEVEMATTKAMLLRSEKPEKII